MTMTIIEMRDRLNSIITDNEKNGWGERNNSEMAVGVTKSKFKHDYRTIKYVSGAWLGLGSQRVFEIIPNEIIWKNYK